MQRVLITGATGFIGPYLLQALAKGEFKSQIERIALIRPGSTLNGVDPSSYHVVYGDVTDPSALRSTLRPLFEKGIDCVFHLAGKVSVNASSHKSGNALERSELERVNVQGTQTIVDLCHEFWQEFHQDVGRLIYASSVVAVGASASPADILNENSVNLLRKYKLPNFESKARSEEIVLKACREGKIDAVVVNLSMVFGAGDAKKAPRKGNILAARGELGFYTQGGLSVVSVEDVADGLISAWKKGRKGERYILSGENLTFKNLLGLYAKATGASPPRYKIPNWLVKGIGNAVDRFKIKAPLNRESSLAATHFFWYDHSKARKELDFHPQPAHVAIESSVRWMKKNGLILFILIPSLFISRLCIGGMSGAASMRNSGNFGAKGRLFLTELRQTQKAIR